MPCASTAWINANGNGNDSATQAHMSSTKIVLCVYAAREDDAIREKEFSCVTKRALQLGNKKIKLMGSVWSICVL